MAQEIKILGSTSNTPTSLGYRQPAVSFTGGKAKFYVGDNTDTAQQINSSSNVIGIAASTSNAHQSVVVKGDGSGFEARNDVPTYTAVEIALLTNVPTNFIIYNSTAASFQKYNGTTWDSIGGGGSAAWGDITGTLSDQTDLQSALDAKQATITFGTGVQTALGVNIGSAGAPVVNGGVLGTPSSGTATNLTGLPLTSGVTGTLPIANGGTNATTASAARTALGLAIGTDVQAYLLSLDEIGSQTIITESTTARTLALTDANDYIRCTNASATTITVPTNASVSFKTGTQIDVFQAGTGQVSFVAAGGVTINKAEGLKIAAQYKAATLKKVGTNEWDLLGALAA